jgi:hypothetical protein
VGRGKRFGHDWNRVGDAFLGGWQIAGIYRWTSGFPFGVPAGGTWNTNFQLSGNTVLTGAVNQGLTYVNGQPFAFNIGSAANDPAQTSNYWNSVLRLPYPGESGQRNIFRGQGFFGIDAGVNKTFRVTERQAIRFSAYAYNLTNSVRFDAGTLINNSALTNPSSIGLYSGTLTKPRVMEFALRYSFSSCLRVSPFPPGRNTSPAVSFVLLGLLTYSFIKNSLSSYQPILLDILPVLS